MPYPGVATDYKPFLVTLLSVADGVGTTKWANGLTMHFTDFLASELEELLAAAGFGVFDRVSCEAHMEGASETHLFYLANTA